MTVTFNLIDAPWIPALRRAGDRPALVSLRGALNDASQWREIHADSPLTTAAVHRLCLAVLHAALRGPENPKQWKKWWHDRHWDARRLNDYLDEWQPRFDLFGKYAFWQVKEGVLDKDEPAMFLGIGADRNMGTLFDHRTAADAPPLTLRQAAQALVTAQTFKLGGGVSGGGFPNFTDAPWARGVIFFAEGDTLFETLALNLVRYPLEPSVFKYQTDDDLPVWERDDPFKRKHDAPRGYLDYLTWPSRRIRLTPPVETSEGWRVTRIQIAQGLPSPKELKDPAKRNYDIEKPKPKQAPFAPLKFESGRALWRDSATLYSWRDKKLHRPHVCNWLAELANPVNRILDSSQHLRLMAFGMATEKANIHFARAERLPLPLSFLTDENLVGKFSEATEMADKTGDALQRTLYTLAAGLTDVEYNPAPARARTPAAAEEKPKKRKKWEQDEEEQEEEKKPKADEKLVKIVNSWGRDAPFWDALEGEFERFVNALDAARDNAEGRAQALGAWQKALRRAAFETLDSAQRYVGDSPRALRAGVAARGYLAFQLGSVLPQAKPIQQEENA